MNLIVLDESFDLPKFTISDRLYGQALAEPLVFSPPTMEMIESGKYVNDVDECLNGAHNCAPQALCMNTPGLLFVIDNEAFCLQTSIPWKTWENGKFGIDRLCMHGRCQSVMHRKKRTHIKS